jgi:hypothetical protein
VEQFKAEAMVRALIDSALLLRTIWIAVFMMSSFVTLILGGICNLQI